MALTLPKRISRPTYLVWPTIAVTVRRISYFCWFLFTVYCLHTWPTFAFKQKRSDDFSLASELWNAIRLSFSLSRYHDDGEGNSECAAWTVAIDRCGNEASVRKLHSVEQVGSPNCVTVFVQPNSQSFK